MKLVKQDAKITFKEVLEVVIGDLRDNNKSEAMIKVHRSAFKKYIKEGFGHNFEDEIDSNFTGFMNFDITSKQVGKKLWGNTTWKQMRSKVRRFYRAYIKMKDEQSFKDLPQKFEDRLSFFKQLRGVTLKSIAKSIKGLSAKRICTWTKGANPSYQYLPIIKEIEFFLKCEGKLTETLVEQTLIGARLERLKVLEKNDYFKRRSFQSITQTEFGLKIQNFPIKLLEDWNHMFSFHT